MPNRRIERSAERARRNMESMMKMGENVRSMQEIVERSPVVQEHRRIEKAREERFIKGLTDARDALDSIIDDVELGDTENIMDALEAVDVKLDRVHRQAQRVEGD